MAITRAELLKQLGSVSFEQCDTLVTLRFHEGALTSEWWSSQAPLYQLLSQILLSWDVLDDDGRPLVPTPGLSDEERIAAWETILSTMPLGFLYELERRILAAVRSGESRKPSSSIRIALAA
jgi:hypothetical protein